MTGQHLTLKNTIDLLSQDNLWCGLIRFDGQSLWQDEQTSRASFPLTFFVLMAMDWTVKLKHLNMHLVRCTAFIYVTSRVFCRE